MEVAVDQYWRPVVDSDVEEVVEAGLTPRQPRLQFSTTADLDISTAVHDLRKGDNGEGPPSENSAYLDKNGGAVEDLDIPKIVNAIRYGASTKGETKTAIANEEETEARSEVSEEEIEEEEVVELEFENAIPKLHTHTMHCPYCDYHITKVVLRRKIIKKKSHPIIDEPTGVHLDLVGCLSCFSLFVPSGDGCFNPFSIFKNRSSSNAVLRSQPVENEGEVGSREEGNCFSIFRVFKKRPNVTTKEDLPRERSGYFDQPSPGSDQLPVKDKHPSEQGENDSTNTDIKTHGSNGLLHTSRSQPNVFQDGSQLGVNPPQKDESKIDILADTSTPNQDQTPRPVQQESTSFEILKSIVYGGLMEIIASLSIVASAAASDATTLNIIALALANLVGGIIVIGHNLWDLRDDCYKFSGQQTDQETRNKYKDLLGRIEHFPLHVFVAILSFLVFGIIPPLTYGYSFHETNDKDYTVVAVAVASLLCVGLLGIFKAYIDRCEGFFGYVKTIVYYVTTAVSVSGASYVVGNLLTRLIEELGLFDTGSNVAMTLLPDVTTSRNPFLAYN